MKSFLIRVILPFLSDRNWGPALLSLPTAACKSTWFGPLCSSGSPCSTATSRATSELCTWRRTRQGSTTTLWVQHLTNTRETRHMWRFWLTESVCAAWQLATKPTWCPSTQYRSQVGVSIGALLVCWERYFSLMSMDCIVVSELCTSVLF